MNHDFISVDPVGIPEAAALALFRAECRTCGITWGELIVITGLGDIGPHPCTGNAYVCRVARKLRDRFPFFWGPHRYRYLEADGLRHEPSEPWAMTNLHLRVVIDAIRYLGTCTPNEAIDGLIRRIDSDPTVCPILADALEEAGCTDSALLEALRTP